MCAKFICQINILTNGCKLLGEHSNSGAVLDRKVMEFLKTKYIHFCKICKIFKNVCDSLMKLRQKIEKKAHKSEALAFGFN